MKVKNSQYYSRYTDRGPSIVERVNITIRYLLRKPVFEKGKADLITELPSGIKQYNNKTTHSSTKMSPIQASEKSNERIVYNNLKDNREFRKPKVNLGQLVRTAEIRRVFSEGDSTNYSYILYTITEIVHETFPSYRIDYLPERFKKI